MSSQKSTKVYVMDTNILIGFQMFAPIKFSKTFWDRLEVLLAEGKWVLLDVVVDEIKYNKDLMAWCKKQKDNGLVKLIEDEHRLGAVEINNKYKMIDEVTQKSEVDTYIIAYAQSNGFGVFTREGFKDPIDKDALYKIPDVCKALGIKWQRTPEYFLKDIGF